MMSKIYVKMNPIRTNWPKILEKFIDQQTSKSDGQWPPM